MHSSASLPLVPAKVVEKILSGQFVDMAELVRDNLEVEQQCNTMESVSAGPVPTTSWPGRREVPDLLSWVQCFGMFASVMASNYPKKITQLLAYQTIIIREARRCVCACVCVCGGGGRGGRLAGVRQNVPPAGRLIPWCGLVAAKFFSIRRDIPRLAERQG